MTYIMMVVVYDLYNDGGSVTYIVKVAVCDLPSNSV